MLKEGITVIKIKAMLENTQELINYFEEKKKAHEKEVQHAKNELQQLKKRELHLFQEMRKYGIK